MTPRHTVLETDRFDRQSRVPVSSGVSAMPWAVWVTAVGAFVNRFGSFVLSRAIGLSAAGLLAKRPREPRGLAPSTL